MRPSRDGDNLFARAPYLVSATVDTGVLIIDAAQARFVDLNHAAGHFWQLLVYPRSLRSLIAAARESFDIDAETCRLEIEQWLDDMMEQGLVIRAPAEAGAASRA